MKIIIVEDSRVLAKIIAKRIVEVTSMQADIANDLEHAKILIDKNRYAFALLDLHLPDAEGTEIVDLFLEHKIPSIVMTSSLDNDLHQMIREMPIVDYVIKNRSESIDYIINLVSRVLKNRQHKALIVDDSAVYRKEVERLLNLQLIKTITAKDGEEALKILYDTPDITLVVTDYELPNINGLEVVLAIRKLKKKYELPIIGISSQKENSIQFLKHGVNDFVRKPFFKEELSTRVNNTIDSVENIQKLHNFANTDFLTGIANRKYFYSKVEEYYTKSKLSKEPFSIAMIDIDFFKKINDTYGHDVGDRVIQTLAKTLKDNIKGQDVVARFGGEEFCIFLKNISKEASLKFFESIREKIEELKIEVDKNKTLSFTVSIGVSTTPRKNLNDMIIDSDKALYEAKNCGRNRVCHYQEDLALA